MFLLLAVVVLVAVDMAQAVVVAEPCMPAKTPG
jgi:hypothetical protein